MRQHRSDITSQGWGSFFQLMRDVSLMPGAGEESQALLGAAMRPWGRRPPAWLRLHQPARLDFAPSEVASVEWADTKADARRSVLRVGVRHFGLFAPYGPLPIHVTEHAQAGARNAFEQFLGFLCAELAWLDFRAWAHLQPAVGFDDSRNGNAFVRRLSLLAGVEGNRQSTDAHVEICRTHFVGSYASRHRPPQQLSATMSRYFGVKVGVRPRTGGWLPVSPVAGGKRVARRWILGSRVFAPQSTLDLVVGPIDASELHRFRRGGELVRSMVAISEDYTGRKVSTRVIVDVRTRPGINGRLGLMKAGIDSWASPVEQTVRRTIHEPHHGKATS